MRARTLLVVPLLLAARVESGEVVAGTSVFGGPRGPAEEKALRRVLEAYVRAHKDVLDQRVVLDIPGFGVNAGVWMGEGAEISPDAVVDGPAVIGPGVKIGAGCKIGEYAVLGSNVRLLDGVQVERSVVHDNAYIGSGVRLRGADRFPVLTDSAGQRLLPVQLGSSAAQRRPTPPDLVW